MLDRAVLNHVGEQLFTDDRCREILRDFVEEQGSLRQQADDRRRLLVREHDENERRLARWYERIESDGALEDVAADRISELKARRAELEDALKKASAHA